MKLIKPILIVCTITFTSCLKFNFTADRGYRLVNPQKFKYNKSKYDNSDRARIDTNAIYVVDSITNKFGDRYPDQLQPCEYVRFFSGGQVLFYNCDSKPLIQIINDKNDGSPGYFITRDNRIMVDRFAITNGGQLERYFGIIQDTGDLIFYEQSVCYCHGSFKCLEKKGEKTFWKKTVINEMQHYQPSW